MLHKIFCMMDHSRDVPAEVRCAIAAGVPVGGICLYPIVNHPGWLDNRHCLNGLFDCADDSGRREIYQPLARELQYQQLAFDRFFLKEAGTPAEVDATLP